jgi:hypothetical protein
VIVVIDLLRLTLGEQGPAPRAGDDPLLERQAGRGHPDRGVERQLIGGGAVTSHAIPRQLRHVQLDQVFHLPALSVDVLGGAVRRL